ncbi:MAG: AroB-related putative sugar phosphate phospholyase (cyclizing), partial [Thermoleophilaceae bacterium]
MCDLQALVIESHAGPYEVTFDDGALRALGEQVSDGKTHVVIDDRVASLYEEELAPVLGSPSVLRIEASEPAKSLDRFPAYIEHLVARGVRRGHVLVAVGGGVIQDIVCFLAATLLRGLEWHFVPTTLLAQADSCIGSKSSINVGSIKNVLGTFTPPARVTIATRLLDTLSPEDVRSGVGEMLKVHAIEGPEAFDAIAADYSRLFDDRETMERYVHRSLEIKKRIIEIDEFDRGPRNVMNYGHSFGHALESATDFAVPHGIAVTIGMDMANYTARQLGLADGAFERMHGTLAANY